jgi:hypothetical protein
MTDVRAARIRLDVVRDITSSTQNSLEGWGLECITAVHYQRVSRCT